MRVIVAEDQLLTREGVVHVLASAGVDVVGESADVATLMSLVATQAPDAAVVDIRMPPTHTDEGLVAAARIRREFPATAVLIVSQHVEPAFVMRLLEEGGTGVGYLLKDRILDRASLLDSLHRVVAGECVVDPSIVARLLRRERRTDPLADLTEREREVLAEVAEGLTNAEIGRRLFITERTVEVHTKQIFAKLGLESDQATNRRVMAVLTYLRAAT
jgi:DNA-binding NarL/FixJ family response regulator